MRSWLALLLLSDARARSNRPYLLLNMKSFQVPSAFGKVLSVGVPSKENHDRGPNTRTTSDDSSSMLQGLNKKFQTDGVVLGTHDLVGCVDFAKLCNSSIEDWLSSDGTAKALSQACCMEQGGYSATFCSTVLDEAFGPHDDSEPATNGLCNTVMDLAFAHFDHKKDKEGSNLLEMQSGQATESQVKTWSQMPIHKLSWYLEPIFKPLGVSHSVLLAVTAQDTYRIEVGGSNFRNDVIIASGGASSGQILAEAEGDDLKNASVLSLLEGFPGGRVLMSTNNCHEATSVAFRHVAAFAAPEVPNYWWQQAAAQMVPEHVQERLLENWHQFGQ